MKSKSIAVFLFERGLVIAGVPNRGLIPKVKGFVKDGVEVRILSTVAGADAPGVEVNGEDGKPLPETARKKMASDAVARVDDFCTKVFGQTFPVITSVAPGMTVFAADTTDVHACLKRAEERDADAAKAKKG